MSQCLLRRIALKPGQLRRSMGDGPAPGEKWVIDNSPTSYLGAKIGILGGLPLAIFGLNKLKDKRVAEGKEHFFTSWIREFRKSEGEKAWVVQKRILRREYCRMMVKIERKKIPKYNDSTYPGIVQINGIGDGEQHSELGRSAFEKTRPRSYDN